MNRATLLDNLAIALRRVAEGKLHIAQQHESIGALERLGLDTSAAKAALLKFEELQAVHAADRDRLRKELAEKHPMPRPISKSLTFCPFGPGRRNEPRGAHRSPARYSGRRDRRCGGAAGEPDAAVAILT
jgi:hypothetical protein